MYEPPKAGSQHPYDSGVAPGPGTHRCHHGHSDPGTPQRQEELETHVLLIVVSQQHALLSGPVRHVPVEHVSGHSRFARETAGSGVKKLRSIAEPEVKDEVVAEAAVGVEVGDRTAEPLAAVALEPAPNPAGGVTKTQGRPGLSQSPRHSGAVDAQERNTHSATRTKSAEGKKRRVVSPRQMA